MATITSTNQREETGQGKAQDTADKAKQFGERARETAAGVAERARETATGVAERARDFAGNVADKTKETAAALGHRAEETTRAVGQGMESLAGNVRQNLPHSGVIGSAAASVAGGLESSGKYLEEHGLQGMGADFLNLIRRNPIPALFLGIGLGFILARATAPRN